MRLVTARNALVRLFRADETDPLVLLGAGLLANGLRNLEIMARGMQKKADS